MKKILVSILFSLLILTSVAHSRVRIKNVKITLYHNTSRIRVRKFGRYYFRFTKYFRKSSRHGKYIKGVRLMAQKDNKIVYLQFMRDELAEGLAKTAQLGNEEVELRIEELKGKHGPNSHAYRTIIIRLSVN